MFDWSGLIQIMFISSLLNISRVEFSKSFGPIAILIGTPLISCSLNLNPGL